MSETLTAVGGELIASKGEAAVLNYTLDYTPDLATGETLTNSTWSTPTVLSGGITLSGSAYTDSAVTIVVSGGTSGQWYVVKNVATGSTGLTHEGSIRLFVSDPTTLGAGIVTPFPSIPGAIASLRRDRLMTMLNTYLPAGTVIDDDYLLQKLVAAQSYLAHRLRVPLVPTEMLPNTVDPSETAALDVAHTPYALEPAYDYDPAMFIGNTWGRMETRQRPIIDVHSMKFVYPTPTSTLFEIPRPWIRVDKKFGVINLLPIQTSMMLPLNAFILSALGGGRTVPAFIQIRYSAGLTNVSRDYPEILDLILKQTALGIAEDLYLPSSRSESTSADGLSQSTSIGFKIDDYTKLVDEKLSSIKSSLFGIPIWSV
jgi:hypothetical protein